MSLPRPAAGAPRALPLLPTPRRAKRAEAAVAAGADDPLAAVADADHDSGGRFFTSGLNRGGTAPRAADTSRPIRPPGSSAPGGAQPMDLAPTKSRRCASGAAARRARSRAPGCRRRCSRSTRRRSRSPRPSPSRPNAANSPARELNRLELVRKRRHPREAVALVGRPERRRLGCRAARRTACRISLITPTMRSGSCSQFAPTAMRATARPSRGHTPPVSEPSLHAVTSGRKLIVATAGSPLSAAASSATSISER